MCIGPCVTEVASFSHLACVFVGFVSCFLNDASQDMATISDLLPPTTTPLHHALKKAGFESVDHCKQWFKCINMSHGTVEEMCRTVESWVDKWDRKEGRMTLQEMVVALHQASVEKSVKSKKMILVKNGKTTVLHPNTSTCFVLYSALSCSIYFLFPPPPLI